MNWPLRGSNPTTKGFHALARDYYAESFERFPVWGGWAGIKRFQSEIGSAKPETHERQARLARRTLERIESLPLGEFEGEDLLDRRQLVSHLRQESMNYADLRRWRTNPQIHLSTAADGIHTLLTRYGDDLRPAAGSLASRLRAIPRFLDEAIDCIDRPVPLWVRLTSESAPGVEELLLSLPAPVSEAGGGEKAELDRLAKRAAASVRQYARRVERKSTADEGAFAIGPDRFQRLIHERLGMNLTPAEAVATARGLAQRLGAELKAEANRFDRRKTAGEILEAAAAQWTPEGRNLLSTYRRMTRDMKTTFRHANAMTFPRGERCRVKPVPEFMRHQFPTAAYSSPGPLDVDQTGIFWVNDLSEKQTSDAARRRELAQHFGAELTAAHEAYPGHHLQFVRQNQHESRIRRMADHAIYYEGWTLWCEQMCVDLNAASNPYLRLLQLHDALWRAWRIVIDCGLQTGTLSYDGAVRMLQREVGFTRARARGDVNWYTSSPTVPMSYLLGKMELLRLKRLRVDRGGWSLKRFNDWILSFGAIPWSWIESSGL